MISKASILLDIQPRRMLVEYKVDLAKVIIRHALPQAIERAKA